MEFNSLVNKVPLFCIVYVCMSMKVVERLREMDQPCQCSASSENNL